MRLDLLSLVIGSRELRIALLGSTPRSLPKYGVRWTGAPPKLPRNAHVAEVL
jgi:hypothetical protein